MADTAEKRARSVMLFDFYAALLSERQRQILSLYYNEDMSLGEISDETGITRQGVHEAIRKSEMILEETETKLSLVKRFGKCKERLGYIADRMKDISKSTGLDLSDVINAVEEITENI